MRLLRNNGRTSTDPALSRVIPSLDGIRALAVLCVIWGHGAASIEQTPLVSHLRSFLPSGYFGVQVFFVLSGFLITTLLVRERQKSGRIAIGAFYRRRAYRILPALWVYLLVLVALIAFGVIGRSGEIGPRDFFAALFFYRNYYPTDGSWWTGHIWSLSVEEQFYILWPLLVILLPRAIAIRVLVVGVIVSPVIRVVTYLLPHGDLQIALAFHTRADALMVGCLLAFGLGTPRFERLWSWITTRHLHWAIVIWFPLSWILTARFSGVWLYPIGYLGDALAVATLMVWLMRAPRTWFGRALNWPPVVHIGLISYSLYLYQQLFMTSHNTTWFGQLTIGGLIGLFVAAELSYHLVEQPFMKLRVRRDRAAALRRDASETPA